MTNKDRVDMAFRNLRRRKSRTILTIVSVMIGTTSIIIMIALGLGLKNSQMDMIKSFANLTSIAVSKDASNQAGPMMAIPGAGGGGKPRDQADMNKLKKIPHVKTLVPSKEFYGEIKLKSDDSYSFQAPISVVPDQVFKELTPEMMSEGKKLTSNDKKNFIIGPEVKLGKDENNGDSFFRNEDNNKNLKAIGTDYTLILGYDENGDERSPFEDSNPDSMPTSAKVDLTSSGKLSTKSFLQPFEIYVNESTYKTIQKEDAKLRSSVLNENFSTDDENNPEGDLLQNQGQDRKYDYTIKYDQLAVIVDDFENVKDVEKSIKDMGYGTQSSTSMIDEVNDATKKMMTILSAIGSIAFIVAAIGIINTMLMSIYERKKEIGVMKVIGASVADIKNMFLIESGFIGFFGGAVGLGVSYLLSFTINNIFARQMMEEAAQNPGISDMSTKITSIPIRLAVVGVLFSSLVGVLAGYIPAKKATNLSAIETLREG